MSFSPNYFSSKVNKECTKPDIYYTSLGSKRLVQKTMAVPFIRLVPRGEVKVKRLLPKPESPKINSMSLKNVKSKQMILQQACQAANIPYVKSESKISIPTASHEKSNSTNLIPVIVKLLPPKPKSSSITEVQNASQSQAFVVDAKLIPCQSSLLARHQVACIAPLDNQKLIAENNAQITEAYCTNTNNISTTISKEDYCTNIDKEQDADLQQEIPVKGDLNYFANSKTDSDPFLSQTLKEDTSGFGKILQFEIDTFNGNPVSNEENIKNEVVIAELTVPISTHEKENNMDDLSGIWSAESMQNDSIPMDVSPVPADMVLVNPHHAEGRAMPSENVTCEASTAATSTPEERESLNTPQHNSEEDMALIEFGLKWSLENEGGDGCLDIANDCPDITEYILNDRIGVEEVSRLCLNPPYATLNVQDIAPPTSSDDEEENQTQNENIDASVQQKKRPGRPRKLQVKKAPKPRGRPVKANLARPASLASHHNYSNGGASSSDSSSNEVVAEQRYRRMRDLNNLASQRCRANRRMRQRTVFDELKHEEERNKELMMQFNVLVEQVKALKTRFINEIANPANRRPTVVRPSSPFDLEQMVTETAERELSM